MTLSIQGRVSVKLRTKNGFEYTGQGFQSSHYNRGLVSCLDSCPAMAFRFSFHWIHSTHSSEEETKPGKDRCSLIPSSG